MSLSVPTKDALFEAVIVDRLQQLVDDARALSGERSPGDAFFALLARWLEEGAVKRDLVEAMAGSGIHVDVSGSPVARELRRTLSRMLAAAQVAGDVRAVVRDGLRDTHH